MSKSASPLRPRLLIIAAVGLLTLAVVMLLPGQNGFFSLMIFCSEALFAALILASATAAGLNVLWLVCRRRCRQLNRFALLLIATGLGLGFLSLASLVLGLCGLIDRSVFIALLALPVPTGLLIFQKFSLEPPSSLLQDHEAQNSLNPPDRPMKWLWILAAVFFGLAVLAAAIPPGVVWFTDSRCQDALERYLAVPKEYYRAGHIDFLPENIYSNLPANMEMLYLLGMTVGSRTSALAEAPELLSAPVIAPPYDAVNLLNTLNLSLGILAVLVVCLAAGCFAAHRTTTGLTLACCPWLLMVATMAYADTLLLFFGALAVWLALAGRHLGLSSIGSATLAGIFTGLACGTDLTAVILLAFPLPLAMLIQQNDLMKLRIRSAALYLLAAFLALSPWLLKNLLLTGNPVFPWFYQQLGGRDFSAELSHRWHNAYGFDPAFYLQFARLGNVYRKFLARPGFGLAVVLLPAAGVLLAYRRSNKQRLNLDLPLLVLFAVQLLAWMGLGNMSSRSFILALIPLCLLAGRTVNLMFSGTARPWSVALMLLLALGTGAAHSILALQASTGSFAPISMQGRVGLFLGYEPFGPPELAYANTVLPLGSRILMVGESRSFYWNQSISCNTAFNLDPLAQQIAAGKSPRQLIDWLTAQGFTCLYVDFQQLHTRAATYGYQPFITPKLLSDMQAIGLVELKRFDLYGPSSPWPVVFYRIVPPEQVE